MVSQRVFADSNLDPRFRAGLVGHWIGGGSGLTWFDRSGYGNHGAISGAGWTLGHNGMDALSFDGTNDYVDAGTSSSLNPNTVTISAWFKTTAVTGRVVSREASDYRTSYALYVIGGQLRVFVSSDTPSNSFIEQAIASGVNDGNWHHVVSVITTDGIFSYLDGVLKATNNWTRGSYQMTRNVLIGATNYADTLQIFFNGSIDDVRIYNRAISAAEIALLASPSFSPIIGGGLICGL